MKMIRIEKDKHYNSYEKRMAKEGVMLYLPALLIIFLIIAFPLFYALYMGFTNYRPTLKTVSFVGFTNYVKVLTDVKFWQAMGRSFSFTIVSLSLQIVLGLFMACLLNNPRLKGKMLVRGLAITPWLLPTVSVAMVFKWMVNDLYGIINFMLVNLGIISEPYAFMSHGWSAMMLLIIANVWRGTPLMITMFLAALQGIPSDYYEAARVDGATAWYSFRKITFPLLLPVVMVSGVLRFIWTFNFYDLPWVMTQGGPGEATQTTSVYAYRKAFSSYRLGEGSAISIVLFIVLLIFAVIYFKAKKHQDKIYK